MVSPSTILLSFSALAAVLATSASDAAPTACRARLVDLGTLGGASSEAVAMNNHGVVVGSALTRNGAQHAFAAQPGRALRDLSPGLPEPTQTSRATTIDDAGVVAGVNNVSAWVWPPIATAATGISPPALGYPCNFEFNIVSVDRIARDGTLVGRATQCLTFAQDLMAILPPLDGDQRVATLLGSRLSDFANVAPDIDRRGDIAYTPSSLRFGNCAGARWQQRDGTGGYLDGRSLAVTTAERSCSVTTATSAAGWVVGYTYDADAIGGIPAHLHQGYVHQPRRQQLLTLTSPLSPTGATWADGISPSGRYVAGAAAATQDAEARSRAAATRFSLDPASGQYVGQLIPLGEFDATRPTRAVAVNDAGQILGANMALPADYFVQRGDTPAVWLNQRFPQLTDITLMMQNERGQLAGNGRINGLPRAFRIDCPLGD